MFWILGFLLLVIALMIPILAIVLDSPVARNLVRGGDPAKMDDVLRRLETLETEVSNLEHSLDSLKEETRFVQRLLQDGGEPNSDRQLPNPES